MPDVVLTAPGVAAIATARALGLTARIEPRVADLDFGLWSGRTLADIHGEAPDKLAAWLADPTGATPGGEAMAALQERVGGLIDDLAGRAVSALVVSPAAPIRAALAHALAMPLAVAMRVDIAPLSRLLLSHQRGWRLQELRRAGE